MQRRVALIFIIRVHEIRGIGAHDAFYECQVVKEDSAPEAAGWVNPIYQGCWVSFVVLPSQVLPSQVHRDVRDVVGRGLKEGGKFTL